MKVTIHTYKHPIHINCQRDTSFVSRTNFDRAVEEQQQSGPVR